MYLPAPTYLSASRLGIYYFRFPIPMIFHPEGRASDLKTVGSTPSKHAAAQDSATTAILQGRRAQWSRLIQPLHARPSSPRSAVFSGMSRAVIHNSNYASVEEAKAAIDRYFLERNENLKRHPKRAGNKIWGKEPAVTSFSESNNCKDSRYR